MSTSLTRRSVLATCAVVAVAGCNREATGPAAPRSVASASEPQRSRADKAASPVRLAIPGIGVDARLVRLGLNDDGTVEVPTAPETAGWFGLGTVPGRRGSAVILGHVDSVAGPAVFAGLSTLRSADRVRVVLSDDRLVEFEVTGVETYANADFPAQRVYAGSRRARTLNLVTCGGAYDPGRGGYQSNVVVYTRRVQA